MNKTDLITYWKQEEERVFKGWDFESIDDKMTSEDLPWAYRDLIHQHLKQTDELLDMGTGGGEYLLSLNHPYNLTSVTEAYPPNITLCKERLTPLGIRVEGIEDDVDKALPFDDESFDVIINRHESYNLDEVNRILKPGGVFISQQVGARNNEDLARWLLGERYKPDAEDHSLDKALSKALSLGMEILDSGEAFPKLKFFEVGAFVYFAKIIEWEFTDFSVEKDLDKLLELNEQVEEKGYFTSTEQRYMLVLKKAMI